MSESQIEPKTTSPTSTDKSPSHAVIEAVAEAAGLDQTELQPLYNVCDPEALDSLFQETERRTVPVTGKIRFQYHGYTVCVSADGQVQVLD